MFGISPSTLHAFLKVTDDSNFTMAPAHSRLQYAALHCDRGDANLHSMVARFEDIPDLEDRELSVAELAELQNEREFERQRADELATSQRREQVLEFVDDIISSHVLEDTAKGYMNSNVHMLLYLCLLRSDYLSDYALQIFNSGIFALTAEPGVSQQN
jgi:hypothetical protein